MGLLKIGVCPECTNGREVPLTSGLCAWHYWANKRASTVIKQLLSGKPIRTPKVYTPKQHKEQKLWFSYHLENCKAECENCHQPISLDSTGQAHILPKNKFPSVQAVLENHMTLGGFYSSCRCHAKWDKDWETAQAMPVANIAIQRFLTFKHLIAADERRLLPEFLKILL